MKLISIILPVYNGAHYLAESIESVLTQTHENFELIIVDDCSTDNTATIAKNYAGKDSRIHYHRNSTNIKLPATLNAGFAKARGDYWTWTSCDNAYKPDALKKMAEFLDAKPNTGLVYASMDIIDSEGNVTHTHESKPGSEIIYANVVGACFLYRAILAQKIGPYDTSLFLCEDYEFWLRCALNSEVCGIRDNLYRYRQHDNSLSALRTQEIIKKGIMIQLRYKHHFIKTRAEMAKFYNSIRERDMLNPFRHLYFACILFYSPQFFYNQICKIIKRRINSS